MSDFRNIIMSFIEHKYIGILSVRLDRFAKRGPSYNFRCPICGDSQKNKYKSRGYILEKEGRMTFYCHNCGASMAFSNFVKYLDPELHKEYVLEKFTEKNQGAPVVHHDVTKVHTPKYRIASPLVSLKKISQLSPEHPAKKYVVKRQIPPNTHYKLFFCPKFKEWVNSIIPQKFDLTGEGFKDEPRLILPFLDKDENLYGFQGRSFSKDGIRYITIMIDQSKPKLFGLDTVNTSKLIYVTEGPIDSLFLPNGVAMAGADADIQKIFPDNLNICFVYDNEPRNKEINKKMASVIDLGYNIVIWPQSLEEKDVNDMVLRGKNIMEIIQKNTFKGLEAKLKHTVWKKT